MRKFLLLCFFLVNTACASDKAFIDYFAKFHHVFSSAKVSEGDYYRMIDYDIDPIDFANYDTNPPGTYEDGGEHSSVIVNEIMFNGGISKSFFLKYLKDVVLSGGNIPVGHPVDYKTSGLLFTFKINEYSDSKVVIYENILLSVGDGNFSETACFYDFSRLKNGEIKLINILCAG